MRFCADMRWSPEGTLEGDIAVEGAPSAPFYGVIQLVGLIEARLGPPPNDTDPYDRRRDSTPSPSHRANR